VCSTDVWETSAMGMDIFAFALWRGMFGVVQQQNVPLDARFLIKGMLLS